MTNTLIIKDVILAKNKAKEVVNGRSIGCAGVALIPGGAIGLSAIEIEMVYKVAKVYGCPIQAFGGASLVGGVIVFGGGMGVLKVIANTLSFIPFAGSLVAGGFAKILGETTISFFEKHYPSREADKEFDANDIEFLKQVLMYC